MTSPLLDALTALLLVLSATSLFFFMTTRGALIYRRWRQREASPQDHVYPIYSNRHLIRLVDFQPLISAILLFQYARLVDAIVDDLRRSDLQEKALLITSCAFGNLLPRIVKTAVDDGARSITIVDIVSNELEHAGRKLCAYRPKLDLRQEDATQMPLADHSVAVNVIFFLLHELPHPLKRQVLSEACRVIEPGGKLYLAEFHRPDVGFLRALSWLYFKVYEPLGLALWDSQQPLRLIEEIGGFSCQQQTFLHGNFQLIIATRRPS